MTIYRSCICNLWSISASYIKPPVVVQIRWFNRGHRRKPLWMPTAKSKFYRIPEHPYVSPEEKDLTDRLLDEYNIKVESMRKLFQEELSQKFKDEGNTLEKQKESEEEFRLLLEDNKKENERIKVIREETLERLLQQKEAELLELEENRRREELETKQKVDQIVCKEKERIASYVTYDNLEEAIDKAMENPVNYSFAINMTGSLKWEGKPPLQFEEEMKKRVEESIMENQRTFYP